MSLSYVGEIRLFAFPRIPNGWIACDGSLITIADHEVLYIVLGTTFGGDGISSFGVPDLRGRLPVNQGTGSGQSTYAMGMAVGTETVQLTSLQLAAHNHALLATTAASTTDTPGNTVVTGSGGPPAYLADLTGATPVLFAAASTTPTPSQGGVPHDNMMPSLTMSYCIASSGIFPTEQ
jgi:microcystin-dependent protein